MHEVLVSIIVPAYNVERYIEKCLFSILKQTHRNIEVIAVEDGAIDRTGQLLDEIAQTDGRLRVIHQPNAGVSAARNAGLKVACGEYIIFVDGDDYLAPDYVEYMLNLACETGAEFCISTCCYTRDGEEQTKNEYVKTLSPEDATALLLSPEVIVGCWNKIYKKTLLDEHGLWFSTALFYGEGLSFITTAAQKSNCMGVGNRKVYYYRRNNEVSATTKFNIEKIYNGEKSIKAIEQNLTVHSKKVQTMLKLHLSMFYLGAAVRIRAHSLKKRYRKDYRRWMKCVRKSYLSLLLSGEVSIYRKALLLGGCISPWLLMKMDAVRREKIAANSVE